MQEIYVENIKEVLRNKKLLEKELFIMLSNKGKNFFVKGNIEDEYLALKILEAVNFGFSVEQALELKQEGIMFQILNIKDITRRHDLGRIKARIIGKKGKTLNTLKNLTNCKISLHNNQVGIIGPILEIEDAMQAITSLIQGSKQGNVYARLEKQRKKKRLEKSFNFIKDNI